MRKTLGYSLIAVAMTGALLLQGCQAGTSKKTDTPAPAAADIRPPLAIPASFASDEEKLEFAVKAVSDGYYKEAQTLLEGLAVAAPSSRVYAQLATSKYNQNDLQGAIADWTKAADIDKPLASAMKNNIGNALRDGKKFAEAEAAYREALNLDPQQWQAAVNLATMLRVNGRAQEAIPVVEAALATGSEPELLNKLLSTLRTMTQSTNG